MKRGMIAFIMLAGVLGAQPLRADVLLLVHGYLGGARSWDHSGVSALLQQHSWQHAGTYAAGPAGIQLVPAARSRAGHSYYTVDLPSQAPVLVQVHLLRTVLSRINENHATEPVTLVGYSAGGVVARAALVRGGDENVKKLITIATPHLGTVLAEQALEITDIPFPFSIMTDIFGGDAYAAAMRSRSLYADLIRPRPGTLLYWLNEQPHPDIEYVSIVHGPDAAGRGDQVVPAYSQDMNNIAVLRGRSARIVIPAAHGLGPEDGSVLVGLLGHEG